MMVLMSVMGLRYAFAEIASTSPSPPHEQGPTFSRGTVTTAANLRALPSMQSEVVAIAKQGTPFEILAESGRWYHVRIEGGIEAWIGKSLVSIDSSARKLRKMGADSVILPDIMPLADAPPSTSPTTVIVDDPPTTGGDPLLSPVASQDQDTDLVAPASEGLPFFLDGEGISVWSIDTLLMSAAGLEIYMIPSLIVMLVLAIILQLRAARQLRRAMHEVGLILGIIEELSAQVAMVQTGGVHTFPIGDGRRVSMAPVQVPAGEFSLIERAVIQALSLQREVQEEELASTLTQQGFSGVLVKAVIAGIMRKTHTTRLPWIETRYTQGRYSYKLRSKEGQTA